MSQEHNEKGGAPAIVLIVIGVVLMFGGMILSDQTKEAAFIKALAEQGIPLDIGKTVATIGVFMILFPVIKSFFTNPLQEAIGQRNTDLERTFSEAESLRGQMTEMKADYERRLVETEAQAREQIQAQIREAQDLRKTLMAEATQQADSMKKRAQEEIEAERDRALTGIRLQVANLTLQATERILGENMDTDRNRRLIDEFLDQIEVPAS